MTLEDDVKKCCDEADGVHRHVERVKRRCADEAKKDLSTFEAKLERLSQRLNRGVREGLQDAVDTWREARDRLGAHLRLIEAKSFLAAARRLAAEEDFVGAKNELAAAIEDVKEARALLPGRDAHLAELTKEIEHAVGEIEAAATTATESIEQVVSHNERLLEELKAS